jgi:predicted MFS family arabinose efflux permease
MIALLARTDDPNRSYGWQWCLGSLPGIVLVYAAPAIATPKNALAVTFGLVLGFNVLMSAAVARLPARLAPVASPTPGPATAAANPKVRPSGARWPLYVGLLTVFATYSGITGAWAFFGRIADSQGLGGQFAGIVLAIATAASSAVSLLAGEVGQRGARPEPMAVAVIGMVATLALVAVLPGRTGFALGVVISIALAGYVLPLAVGIVSRVDPTGRAAGLPAAALGIGAVAGPAVAGHVYQAAGIATMLAVASAMLIAGLVTYVFAYCRGLPARRG